MILTYITFAKDIEQNDDSDCHQRNDNVHAKHIHIRQTRICEQFLEQMHHWYCGESK